MQARLNDALGATLTRSELTYLLVLVAKERQSAAPAAAWPDYYADFFVDRMAPWPAPCRKRRACNAVQSRLGKPNPLKGGRGRRAVPPQS